jgi:hypothetical protein
MARAMDNAIYEEMKGSANKFILEMVPTSPRINIEVLTHANDQLIGDNTNNLILMQKPNRITHMIKMSMFNI